MAAKRKVLVEEDIPNHEQNIDGYRLKTTPRIHKLIGPAGEVLAIFDKMADAIKELERRRAAFKRLKK